MLAQLYLLHLSHPTARQSDCWSLLLTLLNLISTKRYYFRHAISRVKQNLLFYGCVKIEYVWVMQDCLKKLKK